ncbi:tetratricopeptide repeat protein [Butyrivibrio sp. NC3005]|uniref:tetratricopeptide repeat protein n=1 Tax=Butyrivibrio sp. NC3005 TaxID=1280685 RepID=UPI000428C997|nr:tetratricopeptide repeat protein [Butyrivibrio sp. NC3005]
MSKKTLLTIGIFLFSLILLASGMVIGFRLFVNTSFVHAMEKDTGSNTKAEEFIDSWNFVDEYVVKYNLGNAAYERGEYKEAESYYEEALSRNIPAKKECKIHINLALSQIAQIDFDNLKSEESIKKTIKKLKGIKKELQSQDCAGKDGKEGHCKEADKLRDDIDKEIKKLEEMLKNQPQKKSNSNNKPSKKKNNSNPTKKKSTKNGNQIKKQLKKQQQMSMSDHNDNYEKTKGIGKNKPSNKKTW